MHKKFGFDAVINSFLIIIPMNAVMILLMALFRFVFLVYFADFAEISSMKLYILKAFWMGFRFDLSVIAYINMPVTLVLLVYLLFKKDFIFNLIALFIKYYYSFIFTLLFFVLFVDFGFFSYFKDHYNFLIFGMFEDDTLALIKTIAADYRLYVALALFAAVSAVIIKTVFVTYNSLKFNLRIINTVYWGAALKIIVVTAVIFLNFIAARGSFTMFPLGLFYSQISPNYFINKLCVNPVFPLADTVYLKIKNSKNTVNLKDRFGYKNNSEILNDLKILPSNAQADSFGSVYLKKTGHSKVLETLKPNVILIIMEGFGEMPVLNDSPEFNVMGELKSHFEQDTVFYNFLAAGFITVHGLETTSLNIPQRPFSNQITQTSYSFKCFPTSAVLPYKKAGYKTIALYGGSMTWRDMESFFKTQGFDEIIGEGNIDAKPEDRHEWGLNDNKFFDLIKEYLSDKSSGSPKFIYAMSTGTHPPYKKPKNYVPLSLEIPDSIKKMMSDKDLKKKAIFELYQFANRELAKFISFVKQSEFADNTIIAVTGDHNLRELSNYSSEDMFLRYAVPLYIYIPESLKNKNIDVSVSGSHMDIMPTLYNLSLNDTEYKAFGSDLLNTAQNIAFNIDGLVVRGDIAVKYNFIGGSIQSFKFDPATKKLSPTEQTQEHADLKKYYQAIVSMCDIYIKSQD